MPNTNYFVISLTDTQFADFCSRNRGPGIPFRHFVGIDGSKITKRSQVDGVLADGATGYSRGALGCAMSHLALWKTSVSSGENVAIFEDDAFVRNDFLAQYESLLASQKAWDLILFGCNTDTIVSVPYGGGIEFTGQFSTLYPTAQQLAAFAGSAEDVSLVRLKLAFGLCGYAVSPRGAETLIRRCFPLDNRPVHIEPENRSFPAYAIDCMMASVYPDLRAFVCFPALVMTPNDQATSQTVAASTADTPKVNA